MNINEIGWFQFENLIKSRIPFFLLNLGVDLGTIFQAPELVHIQRVEIKTRLDAALSDLLAKGSERNMAVLLICPTGEVSAALVEEVESHGFVNVYSVRGGLEGIIKERSS